MIIHRVVCQIRSASEGDLGQVSDGYYIIEHDTLIMTKPDGMPIDPVLYRHKLRDSDDHNAIARVLTKQVRRALLGLTETQEAFQRPLRYPAASIA